MSIVVDFTDTESGFERIPPGTYLARVSKIEQKMSQAGKPYLNWEFELSGGELDARKAWYITSLVPKALWVLKKLLVDAFNFSGADLGGEFSFSPEEFIGSEVALIIGEEEYAGQMQSRVLSVQHSSVADSGPNLL